MGLKEYKQKRNFTDTNEPSGKKEPKGNLQFVVQKHAASHLHYDFRLEVEGVLKSWAVPKGPSLNPKDKRLAIQVEDHPFDYLTFEGVIPKGNYGAGIVMVWDIGSYMHVEAKSNKENEKKMRKGLEDGKLSFFLYGKKLKGEFSLVRLQGEKKNQWLLMKKRDLFSSNEDVKDLDQSALSGKNLNQISSTSNLSLELEELTKSEKLKKKAFPHALKPMLATLVEAPFDKKNWLFEIKWDGYRAIAEIEDGKVSLYSRNFLSFNNEFASIVEDLKQIPHKTILDGEVIVLDPQGNPTFESIQNYKKEKKGTLIYYVFDLLYLDGFDLCPLPLNKRKSLLQKMLPETQHVRYCDHIEEFGILFFRELVKKKLEGMVAKDGTSPYQLGKRSESWLKIKTHLRQEAIICGFTEPKGKREHFGSLILGLYQKGKWIYVGKVGTGFSGKKLKELRQLLAPLIQKKSSFPFVPKINSPITWVKPKILCEIKFAEWTKERLMRQPVFMGLREDKNPEEVVKEKCMPIKKMIEKKVNPTHLDKVFWQEEGYTKGDLIDYYQQTANYILPYLIDRPESLLRHPNGTDKESFFQKNLLHYPSWIHTEVIKNHEKKPIHFLVVKDLDSLLYMINLGCIEINPFNSRIQSLHYPDFMIFDLDPEDISFDEVVKVAQSIHQILSNLDIPSVCKTSGGRGLHIYVPMGAKYTHEQVTQFAKLLSLFVHNLLPGITSLEISPSKRQKKIYLDYLRNPFGQTAAAPYCVRPKPGAPVSTPLKWNEVKKGLDPKDFTIKTALNRFKKVGDLFKPVLGPGINLEQCLKKIGSKM